MQVKHFMLLLEGRTKQRRRRRRRRGRRMAITVNPKERIHRTWSIVSEDCCRRWINEQTGHAAAAADAGALVARIKHAITVSCHNFHQQMDISPTNPPISWGLKTYMYYVYFIHSNDCEQSRGRSIFPPKSLLTPGSSHDLLLMSRPHRRSLTRLTPLTFPSHLWRLPQHRLLP